MELIWLLILLSCFVKNGLPECCNLILIVFVFGGETFRLWAHEGAATVGKYVRNLVDKIETCQIPEKYKVDKVPRFLNTKRCYLQVVKKRKFISWTPDSAASCHITYDKNDIIEGTLVQLEKP